MYEIMSVFMGTNERMALYHVRGVLLGRDGMGMEMQGIAYCLMGW